MKIKRIDHINIVVKNLRKAKKFFLSLGFTQHRAGVLEGEWIDKVTGLKNVKAEYIGLTLTGSETDVELLQFINPQNLTTCDNDVINKTGFRHIAFLVEDIEKMVEQLKRKNVQFFSEIQEYTPAKKKLCYLYGPEGIVLELAEYSK